MFLGNSGLIYKKRSDTTKARDLYRKIDMPHKVQMVEGWIKRDWIKRKTENRRQRADDREQTTDRAWSRELLLCVHYDISLGLSTPTQ